MLVVLEGTDGCGKTTLCTILAERLGAMAYATPPRAYLQRRDVVDKVASAEEHYRFYRDGIYEASKEIATMLQGGNKVVSDRYWLTTYTYHRIMGVPVPKGDFAAVVQPDLTVILSLNPDTQMERLLHRGASTGDIRLIDKQQELARAFYQDALELSIPFIIIDTGRFSPNQCADIIVAALESH